MSTAHAIKDIDGFLALRRIAMPGISRDPKHFSRMLFADLRNRGYDVVPVNPSAREIDGLPCAPSVREITPPVQGALVMTPAGQTRSVLEDCEAAGIRDVWLYQAFGPGAVSEAALDFAGEHHMRVIAGECPFMFLSETEWYHRAHRAWRGLTGRLPA
jgi:predicted CoA-binding protein